MGVNHGGVDALMTEPFGDFVDADAFHDQVTGKGVAERVEGEVRFRAG